MSIMQHKPSHNSCNKSQVSQLKDAAERKLIQLIEQRRAFEISRGKEGTDFKDALVNTLYSQVEYLKNEVEQKNDVIKMLVGRKSHTGADACCHYGRETKEKK